MSHMDEQCCSQKIKDYKIKIPVSVMGQLTISYCIDQGGLRGTSSSTDYCHCLWLLTVT